MLFRAPRAAEPSVCDILARACAALGGLKLASSRTSPLRPSDVSTRTVSSSAWCFIWFISFQMRPSFDARSYDSCSYFFASLFFAAARGSLAPAVSRAKAAASSRARFSEPSPAPLRSDDRSRRSCASSRASTARAPAAGPPRSVFRSSSPRPIRARTLRSSSCLLNRFHLRRFALTSLVPCASSSPAFPALRKAGVGGAVASSLVPLP